MKTKRIDVDQTLYEITTEWPETATRMGGLVPPEGRLFVNRGTISGKPVDALKENPLPREAYQLYPHDNHDRPPRFGKLDAIVNHMGNFFDCVRSRQQPISDAESQHRSATTCYLGNISIRLDRSLKWDPEAERFVGDEEANGMLSHTQRTGYEIAKYTPALDIDCRTDFQSVHEIGAKPAPIAYS